jgi:hypothetical protein
VVAGAILLPSFGDILISWSAMGEKEKKTKKETAT